MRSLRRVRRLPQWRKKNEDYSAAKILLDVRNASGSSALSMVHMSWSSAEVGRPKLKVRRKKRQDFSGLTEAAALLFVFDLHRAHLVFGSQFTQLALRRGVAVIFRVPTTFVGS